MTSDGSIAAALPSYDRPPVRELVIGCRFEAPRGFTLPYIGTYWNLVRDAYPILEHHEPLVQPNGDLSIDAATQQPIPRVWMLSTDRSRVLQLQVDAFFLNWRKIDGAAYPRFDPLFSEFSERLDQYAKHIASFNAGEIVPRFVELSYNNVLSESDVQSDPTYEIQRALAYLGQPAAKPMSMCGEPKLINWQVGYRLPAGGAINFKLNQSVRSSNPQVRMTMLEISALTKLKDATLENLRSWYEAAHVAIVTGFAEVTPIQVQRDIWGLND